MFGGPLTGNIKKAELLLEEHLITGRTAMKCVISNNQGTGFKNYSQNVRLIDF